MYIMKSALCILCRKPHLGNLKVATDVIQKKHIDVILIVDEPYTPPEDIHPDIQVIYISDEESIQHGYKHSCKFVSFNHKDVVAWDKAFYYFGCINKSYDFVWLMEDDVLIPSADLLCELTDKYQSYDVVTAKVVPQYSHYGHRWYFWHYISKHMEPPLFSARVCGVGVSKNLFKAAAAFISNHKEIPFIEGFIPTIAVQNQLKIIQIHELMCIPNCIHKPMCDMPFHCGSFDRFTIQQFKDLHNIEPRIFLHPIKTESEYLDLYNYTSKSS